MVFPLETMVFQWFWVWQTIGTNGFSMVFSLETMVFQWFPMVANHWSNDGMVTIHRSGLVGQEEVSCKSREEMCTKMYSSLFRDIFHSVWMLMKFVGMTTCFGEH